MSDHTPGPWMWHEADDGYYCEDGYEPGYPLTVCQGTDDDPLDPIAYPDTDYHLKEEAEANARLISAAPDMLAALGHARDFALDAIRAGVRLKDFDPTRHVLIRQIAAAILKATGGPR